MNQRIRKLFFVCIVFLSAGFTIGQAQTPYSVSAEKISSDIKKIMKKQNIPGVAIALVNEEGIVWTKTFGYSDVANQVPVTEHTLFNIGSLTKLFTTVAVLQLIERNYIGINFPYTQYVPEFSIGTRNSEIVDITVRGLLTHYAGIPSNYIDGSVSEYPMDMKEMLPSLTTEYLAFPLGFVYCYSNLGYSMLGVLIEKMSTIRYEDYVTYNILMTLGMNETHYTNEKDFLYKLSKQYANGTETKFYPIRDIAAGGLCSSISDLSLFAIDMLNEEDSKLLRNESFNNMYAPQYQDAPFNFDFTIGLGWCLRGLSVTAGENLDYLGNIATHGGSNQMFNSKIILSLDNNLGVVVLMNSNNHNEPASRIAVNCLKYAVEEKTGLKKPVTENHFANDSISNILELEGNYATPWGFMQIKKSAKDFLEAEVLGLKFKMNFINEQKAFQLKYEVGGRFAISVKQLKDFYFHLEKVNYSQVLVLYKDGLREYFANKIYGLEISEEWKNRIGSYSAQYATSAPAIISNVSIVAKDNFLILQLDVPGFFIQGFQLAIYPLDKNKAYIMGNGSVFGDILKFYEKGENTFFSYAGLLMTKD